MVDDAVDARNGVEWVGDSLAEATELSGLFSGHLDFVCMSRRLQPGSRPVVVLRVIKERERQINYGTGKDVSDETIADAKEPLQIRWFDDSFIAFPVGR